jgi:hypothetical protein
VIGRDDPADLPSRESVAELVDEREAFSRWRVMNQGLGRFPQDLGFLTQHLQFALVAAELSAGVGESGFEITAAGTAWHEQERWHRQARRSRSVAISWHSRHNNGIRSVACQT